MLTRLRWVPLLLFAAPLAAQVDTVRGKVGETLRPGFRSIVPGCWQIQRLTPTRGIVERKVGCWDSLAVLPPPDTQPTPPPPIDTTRGPIVWSSDWSTAAGNTVTAARDGTKWDSADNINTPPIAGGRITVVPATGLGFPADMVNVLAIRYESTTDNWSGVNKRAGWPLPAVGGVLARRMYVRMSMDGSSAGNHHPVQSAFSAGACAYAAEWMISKGTTFAFGVANLQNGSLAEANNHEWMTTLTRDVTYRVEERYQRVTVTTWKLSIRIYDQSGALIRQNADFKDTRHTGATLAGQADIVTPDPTCLQHFMIVNQGVGAGRGSSNVNADRIYYGGFAVSLTDWVGPYTPRE